MRRPAVRYRLVSSRDGVRETESGAADVLATCAHDEAVVERGRLQVPHVRLGGCRLEPALPQLAIAAAEASEVLDSSELEPHEVGRMVRDSLRVGLRETNLQLRGEAEVIHARKRSCSRDMIRASKDGRDERAVGSKQAPRMRVAETTVRRLTGRQP